jgi:ribosomal protein S18 acetylase RimI-like enzyme
MARLELRAFARDDVDDAAALLVRRHVAQRAAEPSLPAAYERTEVALAEIEELLAAGASGAFATRDGTAVGFMLGRHRPDATWGANVWVEPAAHAVDEPEAVRDLYALAAARWVEEGRNSHYAVVPTSEPAVVDAWFRVGFGLQHVHALREAPAEPVTVVPRGVVIRKPTRDDIDALAELDLSLPTHQALSPVFSAAPLPSLEEARAEWDGDFENPAFATFVGEVDGHVVGSAVGCSVELSSLHTGIARPDGAAHLGFAAVLPEARGCGVGTALGATVLDWAADDGYTAVTTDWRETNLLSSRSWPKLGFRPTFYRLFRGIV